MVKNFILLLPFLVSCSGQESGLAEGITKSKIRSIHYRMPMDSVIQILGKPLTMYTRTGTHNGNCLNPIMNKEINVELSTSIYQIIHRWKSDTLYCCEAYKREKQEGGITFAYSRPVEPSSWYPMLWIHFNSNQTVESVYAKRYGFWFEEDGVYGCDSNCKWEGKLFEDTFKK